MLRSMLLFLVILLIFATAIVALVKPDLVKYAVIPLIIIALLMLIVFPEAVPHSIRTRLSSQAQTHFSIILHP